MDWIAGEVRVFRLDPEDDDGDFETASHWRFGASAPQTLEPLAAAELQHIWEALPPGEPARCHLPHHGFEVHDGSTLVLRAAVCFTCNNISTRSVAGDDMRTFDADSDPAQELARALG